MKKTLTATFYLLFATLFIFSACQTEQVIINDSDGETLNLMSPLADLVTQTTLNDGSRDNIIDNASCISVVLPVTVIANGVELVITTSDQYVEIERIFDASATDQDELTIIFPIKLILPDYTEVEVFDLDELQDIAEECIEGGDDFDIECIDFKYPISFSIFNTATQTTDNVSFNSDEELNEFMDSLEDNIVFNFNFPITMLLSDGTEITVNTNDELENLIEEVEDSCDEDDDNDYNDDDIDNSELYGIMKSSAWVITYYFDSEDRTAAFQNMAFVFNDEDRALVQTEEGQIGGEWELYGDDGKLELELEFSDNYPLNLLDEDDWIVSSYDSLSIELSYVQEDGTTAYLVFEVTDQVIEPAPTIADYIVEGNWMIAFYKDDGADETVNYQNYTITFSTDNQLSFTDAVATFPGDWEELFDTAEHVLALDFGSEVVAFEKLNEDWDVVSYTENSVELIKYDSDTETTDNLILEKIL